MPLGAHKLIDDKTHAEAWHLKEGFSFPSTYASLGLCQLNQWALDFDGNLARIVQSIEEVKRLGGYYRLGPELEVSGYSCDDHFNEIDTTVHCWQSIVKILRSHLSHNCLLDIGMPVEHKSVRYNCRVYILNQEIVLIRPKLFMANEGAYREGRWFGSWNIKGDLETFVLPKSVQRVTEQTTCPIGFAALQCNDCILAAESCEELFVPESPHLSMCLGGVDIFCNGSASYFEINKVQRRLDLIMAPTSKMGGVYLYSNLKGNDGGKVAFDGTSFIACNGAIINMITPTTINDVEVMVERVNISTVRSFRACNPSYALQASCNPVPTVRANIWLSGVDDSSLSEIRVTPEIVPDPVRMPELPEELARTISCWMWDYLRRSRASGFMVALSGGADSCAVAVLVRLMCEYVFDAVRAGHTEVYSDMEAVMRMRRDDPEFPKTPKQMCFQLLHTAYLGMAHSSGTTRARAARLAEQLGAYHVEVEIDKVVDAQQNAVATAVGGMPRFSRLAGDGGSTREDLSVQNVQARSRMVTTYMLAQLTPSVRVQNRLAQPQPQSGTGDKPLPKLTAEQEAKVGWLIVLSTGNLDETLRGYFTKYDCSSGDLNPIGALSKLHLRNLLRWAARELEDCIEITQILLAIPTAELRPDDGAVKQTDEEEMGLTYDELFMLGSMRRCERCGPVQMFELLMQRWKLISTGSRPRALTSPRSREQIATEELTLNTLLADPDLTPAKIAEKVKHFFRTYSANRHKTTTLPPSFHAEPYDPEAARFDWRPFLYPSWERQFKQIDVLAAEATHVERETARDGHAIPHKRTMYFGTGGPGGFK